MPPLPTKRRTMYRPSNVCPIRGSCDDDDEPASTRGDHNAVPSVVMLTSPPPRAEIPKLSALPLVIDTARLKLRPVTPADVDDIWPYVSDPTFPRYMTWAAHKD